VILSAKDDLLGARSLIKTPRRKVAISKYFTMKKERGTWNTVSLEEKLLWLRSNKHGRKEDIPVQMREYTTGLQIDWV